jgi:hypothetical protein
VAGGTADTTRTRTRTRPSVKCVRGPFSSLKEAFPAFSPAFFMFALFVVFALFVLVFVFFVVFVLFLS